ncbi:MAG: MMPL family transporter, partial [Planctomycetales bacterium]|nr:MMPL family transporter [Planctomycetales bacterium]
MKQESTHYTDLITRYWWATTLLLCAITALALYGHLYQPPPGNRMVVESARNRYSQGSDAARPSATNKGDSKSKSAGSQASQSQSADDQQRPDQAGGEFKLSRGPDPHALLVFETDEAFTPHGTESLRKIAAALEDLSYVDEVIWLDTIPTLNVFGLRENLLPPEDSTQEGFDLAREEVLQHPLIRGQLVSDDGRTLLMAIVFDWIAAPDDQQCSADLLQLARDTAEAENFDARITMTGLVPLYIAHKEAFDRNQKLFQRLSYVLVAIVSIVLFRGVVAISIVAIAPAVGIFWTLGLLNLIDDRSNELTNIVLPVLLTMVGLADGVHLMVHIRARRAGGMSSREAASSAIRHVGMACFLTSLTTAAGFGSLMVAESEFVQAFGKSCAVGVIVTFVAVITLIPLLCMLPIAKNIHLGHERDLVGRAMMRFTPMIDSILSRSGWISLISILTTICLATVALQLRADDKMKDNQPNGSPAYQALQHCDEALGGIQRMRVEIDWPEGVTNDEAMKTIQDVERLLEDEPLLKHPVSILSILSSLPGDDEVTERAGFVDLLPASVRRSWYDDEHRQARVTARVRDLGIAAYEPVFQRLEKTFDQWTQEHPGYQFRLAGAPVQRGRNLYKIVLDLARSLGTASLIIFAMLAFAYRSLRLGL